jgi:lipopolysaccharide export system protein LptA
MFGKKKTKNNRTPGSSAGFLGIFFLFFFAALPLGSQTFSFQGDRMETVLAKGKERTVLTGSAEVQTEDNLIRADRVELYGEDFRFVSCEGNVRIVNEQKGIEVTCRQLFYNRQEKVVRVRGNVVMLDKANEVVVKGGFLENWEDSDETVVQIGVRILKEDLVCRAEYARYQRAEDTLELSGMPVVNWKGDEYRALKIYIDLNTDTIRLEGDISGKVRSETGREEPGQEEAGREEAGQ